MTAFYILVQSEDEARDLSLGHVSPQIRAMTKTMLDWELDVVNAAKPVPPARKPRKKKAA